MNGTRRPRRARLGLLSLAALACAACCAAPISAIAAAIGGAALVGAIWMPALAAAALLAGAAMLAINRERRRTASCSAAPVALGIPAVRDPRSTS